MEWRYAILLALGMVAVAVIVTIAGLPKDTPFCEDPSFFALSGLTPEARARSIAMCEHCFLEPHSTLQDLPECRILLKGLPPSGDLGVIDTTPGQHR